jgi:hypothetical protein
MAWTTPRTWVAGELVTAAMMNTHVRDNETELRAGGLAIASQAAGDFLFASSATQFARASGQLAFPAVQNASAGANTLDDYEEGSWTPVIGGSGGTSGQVYSSQVGRYVKIGKLVIAQFQATLSTEGTITTNVQIQGLPFTAENVSGFTSIAALLYVNLATTWVSVVARVLPNTTTADVLGAAAAAATNSAPLTAADIGNTTQLEGTIAYRATN